MCVLLHLYIMYLYLYVCGDSFIQNCIRLLAANEKFYVKLL